MQDDCYSVWTLANNKPLPAIQSQIDKQSLLQVDSKIAFAQMFSTEGWRRVWFFIPSVFEHGWEEK